MNDPREEYKQALLDAMTDTATDDAKQRHKLFIVLTAFIYEFSMVTLCNDPTAYGYCERHLKDGSLFRDNKVEEMMAHVAGKIEYCVKDTDKRLLTKVIDAYTEHGVSREMLFKIMSAIREHDSSPTEFPEDSVFGQFMRNYEI